MNNIIFNISVNIDLDKLKKDLNAYLSLSAENPVIEVDVDGLEKNYTREISFDDSLEVLNLRIKKSYSKESDQIPLITIEVIIGEFEVYKSGILKLEKCVGEFLYDDKMELIDIEFIEVLAI